MLILSLSLSLPLSLCLSRSVLGGWVPVWRSRVIDSSICVCVITAGLIGREEHWDIVITDTPVQPLTHADGGRDSPLLRGRDGRKEYLCECCLFGKGVKRNGRKAVKKGLCRPLFVCFYVGLVELVGKQFACSRFWLHGHFCALFLSSNNWLIC